MKIIFSLLDSAVDIIVWVIVAFVLFGFANMAMAQELTLEQKIITHTILGEARGEGKAGMYGVACVIKQRTINRKKSAKDVCFEEDQFSFWNVDNKNRENVRRLVLNNRSEVVRYAKLLAVNLARLDRSFVNNADHYCRLEINNYWTKKSKPVKVIGNHKFFKLK